MRLIGYSTGAIAKGAFQQGLERLEQAGVQAVELSALREEELAPLAKAAEEMDVSAFAYVSFHAPSRFSAAHEKEVITYLSRVICSHSWPVIVHPDVIHTPALWRKLGGAICIENMDERKHTGRIASEMAAIFAILPEARFCLDLAHAAQVDPTLKEAARMLDLFRDRLQQVHISSLNPKSGHTAISEGAMECYPSLSGMIPELTPIIIESPAIAAEGKGGILREVGRARKALPVAGEQ